jgi:hypothetical protein
MLGVSAADPAIEMLPEIGVVRQWEHATVMPCVGKNNKNTFFIKKIKTRTRVGIQIKKKTNPPSDQDLTSGIHCLRWSLVM